MSARLVRASGAGNTFFIADLLLERQPDLEKLTLDQRRALALEACKSLGAQPTDGLLFLEPPNVSGTEFRWDFYNADGSSAEMCGNAARCVAVYYFQKTNKTKIYFSTRAGVIHAETVTATLAKVKMSRIIGPFEKTIQLHDGRRISGYVVDTGVPHFVTRDFLTKELGREIRSHQEFGRAGTNVTQIQREIGSALDARSYERGVEDFTQACGTGAVAAASVVWLEKNKSPISVKMPGGVLNVFFSHESPHPILEGPAIVEKIFDLNDQWMEKLR